ATLATHIAEPVRFVEQIEAMYAAGARVFVEAGPGRVLTQLIGTILRDRPYVAVATDVPGEPGLRRLLRVLGELAVKGVPVDPTALFHGRNARVVSMPALPRRPGWLVNGYLVKTADGQYLPGGLRPARQVAKTNDAVANGHRPATEGQSDAVVLEFLRNTRELIAAQREIMLGYLGSPVQPPAGLPNADLPAAFADTVAADQAPEHSPAKAVEPDDLTPESVLATVRSLVSERTGYPVDMLEADLDLEADLSIDSIKRTELIGLLTDRLGLATRGAASDDSVTEQLTRRRTIRSIVDWITDRPGAPAPAPLPKKAHRYLVDVAGLPPLAASPEASLAGRRIAIVGDGVGIALELSMLLERRGADVRMVSPDQPIEVTGTDALIHLAALDRGRPPLLPDGFVAIRDAILGGIGQLIVVTGSGGRFGRGPNANGVAGVGLPGLARTIAREFPDRRVRAVDVDPKEQPVHIAGYLLGELLAVDAPTVVGYAAGERVTLQLHPAPLNPGASGELKLGRDSVVLLTGGARGITARVAIGLARAGAGHVELVGRTPAPTAAEDPVTAAATDRMALRRVLAQAGGRTPAQIEAAASQILAHREIRATLAQLSELAGSVRYSAVDVRDPAAMSALLEDVYHRHGRLDGIVHGAGVLADRLLADKSPEEFARVWATKVDGARALAGAVRDDLGFLVLFGSVSGVFGNRGQVDYAAANDALDTLARIWAGRTRGRVVAVDWGPWTAPDDGTGMVSAEVEREYARRGIGLIEPGDGVACLLAELAGGTEPQVMYLCGDPAAFEVGQDG
ncbi:MAG: SDR family NAD(P)-dependent oxidoreductase, partial [Pseudonocardiaceae bacterium]